MKAIEAVVGEGGVLHVENLPFTAGTRVEVKPTVATEPRGSDWTIALVEAREVFARIDFQEPEPIYPEPIEPLRLRED